MDDLKRSASEFVDDAAEAGESVHPTAHRVGKAVSQHPAYRIFVTVGLLAFALVHALIAVIALQIAWGDDGGQDASMSGAFETLARQPAGWVLLAVCAAGLAALTLWQLIEAAIGNARFSGVKRLCKRASSAARAVVYATLAYSAIEIIIGVRGGSEQQRESMTAQVLQWPFGQFIIAIVGLVITGVGVYQAVKGIRRKFREDLDGATPHWLPVVGAAGYVAKGVAIALVGGLFLYSAIAFDPEAAGTTNSALRTLVQQPFGPYLLTLVALGLALFAVYCSVWAFHAEHDAEEGT